MVFHHGVWMGFFRCTFSFSSCAFSLCPSLMILNEVLKRSSEFSLLFFVKWKIRIWVSSVLVLLCGLYWLTGIWGWYRQVKVFYFTLARSLSCLLGTTLLQAFYSICHGLQYCWGALVCKVFGREGTCLEMWPLFIYFFPGYPETKTTYLKKKKKKEFPPWLPGRRY